MSHRFHHGPLVAQHTERAFPEPALWAVFTLLAVLLAIGLAGCQTATMQAGDLRVTQTSLLTKNTLTATCAEFNADGTPASSTSLDTSTVGDAAMAHEIIGGIAGIVSQLKPVPGVGVRQGREGMTAADGRNAASCLLEHFKGEQAPFPPTPPPAQPQNGQQPALHKTGAPPFPAGDPDTSLQRRVEDAASRTETPR